MEKHHPRYFSWRSQALAIATRQLWDVFFQNVQLLKPFLKSWRVKAAFFQVNDRAELRRGESCLGSTVSVLPLAPDQPKTSGQVLGSLKTEILCHWESPLQRIESDSVGGWQLQRSERETTHMGERRRTETPSRPAHMAGPRPSSDTLAMESSAKGLCVAGGTRAAETCQVPCHAGWQTNSDSVSRGTMQVQCPCTGGSACIAAWPGSCRSAAEGAYIFLSSENKWVCYWYTSLFFFTSPSFRWLYMHLKNTIK